MSHQSDPFTGKGFKHRHNYPRHDIDPKRKDRDWILQYIKAFYYDQLHRRGSLFYHNRGDYNDILKYAMGQQDIG